MILKSKCTVSERKIFLEKEKIYIAHLHKQLKPAFGFHSLSEFNILYFKSVFLVGLTRYLIDLSDFWHVVVEWGTLPDCLRCSLQVSKE